MTNDYSLTKIPNVPSIQNTGTLEVPNFFPNGFSLPLNETPAELLDIIAKDFPNRNYRISVPSPIGTYSQVIVEIVGSFSEQIGYSHGKIQYKSGRVKFSYSRKNPFVYTQTGLGNVFSSRINLEYVWKKDEFSARADLIFPFVYPNSTSYRRYNICFKVLRKKKKEKYSIEIPSNFLPVGYWKEGIPCVSSQYKFDQTTFKIPSNFQNTSILEIAPQFKFPFPASFDLNNSAVTNLISVTDGSSTESAYDYALQAGVFPVQKNLKYKTILGWSI